MDYTLGQLDARVQEWGEVFVVLDSDREYELHGQSSYEHSDDLIRAEGKHGDEWLVVEFPLDAIEHVYTHKEV